MDSSQKYSVFYSGELITGFDLKKSVTMLHSDLGLSSNEIRQIITGGMKKIKLNVDLNTAIEITRKFTFCGLYCFYKPSEVIANYNNKDTEQNKNDNNTQNMQTTDKNIKYKSAIEAIGKGFRGVPWGTKIGEGKLKFGIDVGMLETEPHEKHLIGLRGDENLSLGSIQLFQVIYLFADLKQENDGARGIFGAVLAYHEVDYNDINNEVTKNFGYHTSQSQNTTEWNFNNGVIIKNGTGEIPYLGDGKTGKLTIIKKVKY